MIYIRPIRLGRPHQALCHRPKTPSSEKGGLIVNNSGEGICTAVRDELI